MRECAHSRVRGAAGSDPRAAPQLFQICYDLTDRVDFEDYDAHGCVGLDGDSEAPATVQEAQAVGVAAGDAGSQLMLRRPKVPQRKLSPMEATGKLSLHSFRPRACAAVRR